MNSGLEKIPEFLSDKGDFSDNRHRYVRQDENHKCGNQHFQDFAAVCQLHDPACQSHEEEQSRQQIRQDRGECREEDTHPLRQNQQQKQRKRASFSIGFSTVIVGTSLYKNQLGLDDFLGTVADAVHSAHPFQLIGGFQGFGHALGFLHLPDGQCKLFLGLLV